MLETVAEANWTNFDNLMNKLATDGNNFVHEMYLEVHEDLDNQGALVFYSNYFTFTESYFNRSAVSTNYSKIKKKLSERTAKPLLTSSK